VWIEACQVRCIGRAGTCLPILSWWKELLQRAAMTVSAHFAGKVIVPDDRLELPPNQALIVESHAVGCWIAAKASTATHCPVDHRAFGTNVTVHN
jgi:hypothetical protein